MKSGLADLNYTGSSLSAGVLWIAIAIAVVTIATSIALISSTNKGKFTAADDDNE